LHLPLPQIVTNLFDVLLLRAFLIIEMVAARLIQDNDSMLEKGAGVCTRQYLVEYLHHLSLLR
jgi:hypothetical protein